MMKLLHNRVCCGKITLVVITDGPLPQKGCGYERLRRKEANEMSEIIRSIEKAQLRTDLPEFGIGDTVRVFVKVVEGSRERLQAFEGTVMAKRNGSVRETFTVRRVSYGIGVERTFPLHSPRVDHIEVIRRGKVRRAKLYYLRSLQGKAAKIKEAKRV